MVGMDQRFKTVIKLVFVSIVYGVVGFLLYRGRRLTELEILDSDFLVFHLPLLLALLANGWVIRPALPERLSRSGRTVAACFLAVPVTLIPLWTYAFFALNTYGS